MKPTVLKCDNPSSIKLAYNPIYHARTKHNEIQHHFVREKIQSNEIDLIYCNITDNVATSLPNLLERRTLKNAGNR